MATADPGNNGMAETFRGFPFATDQEYQTGLQNILASDAFNYKSDAEKEDTLRLSRVFYFNKDRLTEQQPVGGETHTLTFAELKALIEQGKTDGIPNNKLIPNVLNDAPPDENIGQIRKKPWET